MLNRICIVLWAIIITSCIGQQVMAQTDSSSLGYKKYRDSSSLKEKQAGYSATPAQKMISSSGEDLLSGGNAKVAQTVISGYGEATYQHDFAYKNSAFNLARAVLFVGHQFTSKIAFFSELEVESAKVEGGDSKGEIGMEQAYIKFSLNPRQYIVAGLFTPRIGITNENHLPVNFNGTERPLVEQLIIPTTWREIGVGFYGQAATLPLSYSAAIVSGVSSENMVHGSGFTGGLSDGQLASGNNLALTASLRYFVGDFQFQVSGYMSGTTGMGNYQADSLGLASGPFGTPLYLGEADVQYNKGGFSAKALGTYVTMPDASKVNNAFASNVFKTMNGIYGELSYDLLHNTGSHQQLIGFGRYEYLNLNDEIPSNGIKDPTLKQVHIVTGLNYFPIPNVVIKADVRITHTGPQNKNLIINPPSVMQAYQQNNQFLNIGIGYAF
ncbi:Phosphate-selective porin O and P [Arachidicoccus rhizosphaerae]|uniref:Phosphate-selective porin O and P n=1 Tax=Arachidicoccus rhizosphaerae TaxID=551991 RepID=A0A1H4CWJ2_9BACT|nr:porin [Arachidicoccus rhizosphaerae]SEA64825.1 Phosphate-selective porin O and P [Arachidicoccus rhizosphaerae]